MTVNPREAWGTHISLVAHITPEELKQRLTQVEMANGFGNRFAWFVVNSDKLLPHTTPPPAKALQAIAAKIRPLTIRPDCKMQMTKQASAEWEQVYPSLRQDEPGLAGAMIARRASIVLRLSLIYAKLDKSKSIRVEHLEAALAVWDYCEESAKMLFGKSGGTDLKDKLLSLLGTSPMTKDELNKHLSKKQKGEAAAALQELTASGAIVAKRLKHAGAGRPATRYSMAH